MYQVFAATGCQTFEFGKCNSFGELLNAASSSFFAVVWVIAIVFLAYGGLLYITSAGDKGKAEKAQNALTQALIGIVIILGINVIVSLLGTLLKGGTTFTAPTIGATVPSITP